MIKFKTVGFLTASTLSFACLLSCKSTSAAPTQAIVDNDHHVFVTSGISNGDMSNPDTLCQDAADAAGLTATYKAIISTSTENAIDHISVDNGGEVYIMDSVGARTTVDSSIPDLFDGNLQRAITKDENGDEIAGTFEVFTGTALDGTGDDVGQDYCMDWTDATDNTAPRIGTATEIDDRWIADQLTNWECDDFARLYCISQ